MLLYVVDTVIGLSYLLLSFLTTYVNCHFWSVVNHLRRVARCRKYRSTCKDCIVIFSRYPRPGTTKTRLIPSLGPEGAAYCQLLMTDHILDTLSDLMSTSSLSGGCEVEVQYRGGSPEDMEYWLGWRRRHIPGLVWVEQVDGDLGNKMKTAVLRKFTQGKENVVIIGGDIPGITKHELLESFTKLREDQNMVLGQAEDGGYYLVGFHRSACKYMSTIFENIEWGTCKVFQQQVRNAKLCGAKLGILATVLSDVDTELEMHIFEKEVGVRRSEIAGGSWSVVIPVLNEAFGIRKTLESVVQNCSDINCIKEVLVCDGGSTDNTHDVITAFGRTSPIRIRLIHSPPGRGLQLRSGANEARSECIMFIHGDSILPQQYNESAFRCLQRPGVVAGAFRFALDLVNSKDVSSEDRSMRTKLYWLEKFVSWRCGSPAELPFGDQGLFMRREIYNKSGGYHKVYLMEDFILVDTLKEYGHIGMADRSPLTTSARRWQKSGFIKVTATNHFIITCYKFGVHPDTLARWYYGDKLKIQ
ncbi:uncharacterized protein LOC110451009 [Mizuhopecten yessoensis]|uniref:Glycosyltransferase YdaM n=1 Tax=Mizuhopecten yessoensis TaxID=6573 RepID=A0A210R798_MIZYE|nr:uncharacterized protein LOC110451009 [Mizuhopecten yessoensis]OWF56872.1 glycosyltransferase YdaM [Mizuhopecten yessoensis]